MHKVEKRLAFFGECFNCDNDLLTKLIWSDDLESRIKANTYMKNINR